MSKIAFDPSHGQQGLSEREKIAKVSEEFESLFTEILLKSMRKSVMKSEWLSGGNTEDIYRSMLDSEYAKISSQTRGLGLADAIEKEVAKSLNQSVNLKKEAEKIRGAKSYEFDLLQNPLKSKKL